MSDAERLTARIRSQSIEFFGASVDELHEAAQRFAEHSGLFIYGKATKEKEGVTFLVVVYTNPEIPWGSADEPPMVTFRSGEQN